MRHQKKMASATLLQRRLFVLALGAAVFLINAAAPAGTDPNFFIDKAEWQTAVGEFTTIDFTGFAPGTIITDQYQDQGVTFFNGIDTIFFNSNAFPNDEFGLDGNGDIWVQFDQPMHWVGADWSGSNFQIDLYREGELLSQTFIQSDENIGNFLGLYSEVSFDVAVLIDPLNQAEIDDLFFAVPTPATLTVLLLPLLRSCRRRS